MSGSPDSSRSAGKLLAVALAMFGFGYLLVPLYDVICEVTGLGGKTSNEVADVSTLQVDEDRLVTVEFIASMNQAMPWEVRPAVKKMKVHPGKPYTTSFHAVNLAGREMTGQAVPSVAPGTAAKYFKKTECFCFTEQRFEEGEGRDMPLQFVVDPDLPRNVDTVTLAYTFFEKRAGDDRIAIQQITEN